MDFYIDKQCLDYAINRVLKEKHSKNGYLIFVEVDDKDYLIDGYHRLADHFIYNIPLEMLPIKYKTIKTKIHKKKFIKLEEYSHPNFA